MCPTPMNCVTLIPLTTSDVIRLTRLISGHNILKKVVVVCPIRVGNSSSSPPTGEKGGDLLIVIVIAGLPFDGRSGGAEAGVPQCEDVFSCVGEEEMGWRGYEPNGERSG